MSKAEVFLQQLNAKIRRFDEDSTSHKHDHRRYRYSVFALTALTSVFSGLALSFSDYQMVLNIAILIIGALAGLVAAVEGMRRPHDLWLMERNVYYSLLDLKEDFEYQTADETAVDIDQYHQKMQEVLAASKEKWSRKLKIEDAHKQPQRPK